METEVVAAELPQVGAALESVAQPRVTCLKRLKGLQRLALSGCVAFIGGIGSGEAQSTDGSEPTRLTINAVFDGKPTWSPDGRWIAFNSRSDGQDDIYVMNADGSEPTRLTTNAAFDAVPAWSADGRRIAFNSDRAGNFDFSNFDIQGAYDIYVMNADGSGDEPPR